MGEAAATKPAPPPGLPRKGEPQWAQGRAEPAPAAARGSAPAGQLAPRVVADPAGRRLRPFAQPLCHRQRRPAQRRAALGRLAQRPVHRLFDEIAPIARCGLDQRQPGQKVDIRPLLVMHGGHGQQREAGALLELRRAHRPARDGVPGQRALHKGVGAGLVAHVPGLQARHPVVHLHLGELRRLGHHAGQQLRIRDAGVP
mmetsp:Transcript_68811/g.161904  ORF Transcript_68811/g.161904 Transcript_68811/m.161904 type:complete len:200 (-) Transcript_68811:94-693(-)